MEEYFELIHVQTVIGHTYIQCRVRFLLRPLVRYFDNDSVSTGRNERNDVGGGLYGIIQKIKTSFGPLEKATR